jgi:hypothetical protein
MALNLAYLFGFGLLAFVILIITRGRLGYKPDSTEGSEEI